MQDISKSTILQFVCKTFADPVFILDENGTYVEIAGGAERTLYDSLDYLRSKKLHHIFSRSEADRFLSIVKKAIETDSLQTIDYQLKSDDMASNPKDGPATPQWYHGRVFPIKIPDETVGHVIWLAINITRQKEAELERDRLTRDLKEAMSEIKTLKGILPICANCKSIRDDTGYWNQIESYIRENSDARFTHGICPDCAEKLYPGLDIYKTGGK